MDRKSDELLVEEVKRGDIGAFETLVRRHERGLLAWVTRKTGDAMVAEEIVQDAFFSVYRSIYRIDTKRKFTTYLYAVAKNGTWSYLRKHKKEVPLSDKMAFGEMVYREDVSVVERLESRYRKVIKLYYLEGLSYKEIAQELALPVNTVRTHLKRAKEALRKIWPKT